MIPDMETELMTGTLTLSRLDEKNKTLAAFGLNRHLHIEGGPISYTIQ